MQGKKTAPETIYKIMCAWAIENNYSEVAKKLNVAVSTVKKIVEEHKDEPEFKELCKEKRKEFAKKASVIIDKIMDRIEATVDSEEHIPLNQLSTALGVIYDKRALSRGESTGNTTIEIKLPKEAEKYAE